MKFTKISKIVKAGLSEEELNQVKAKFDKTNWSDVEIYDPTNSDDNIEVWDSLKDTIESDYLTDEQREKFDEKDFEKIIGLTIKQFSENRDLYVQENELKNKLEKYDNDFSELKRLTEDGIGKLNFDYEFIETLYAEKSQLETKIEELENRLNQVRSAIKQTTPKFKTWKEVEKQRHDEAQEWFNKK